MFDDLPLPERIRVARDLDVAAVQRLAPGMAADVALIMLHKVRYEMARHIPDELRHQSRQWLEFNGFTRYRGLPWPPPGKLEH